MHIHICPVEITAALMTVEHGLPYVRTQLCYHAENLKNAIMKRKPVTIWNRINKAGEAEFNHIEDGHVLVDTPTAKTEDQEKAWSKTEWVRKFGYMQDNCIVADGETKA